MTAALVVELRKLRRSTVVTVATPLIAVLIPAIALALVAVAASGTGNGTLGGKASALVIGEGWTAYLRTVDQIAAVAVFLGVGIVTAWVFGREFTDGTFPSLFSMAVPRRAIALAKLVALAVWVSLVTAALIAVAMVLGIIVGIGASFDSTEVLRLASITAGAGMLGLTSAFAASAGRGLLPAITAVILAIVASQVAVLFGTGGWFPFAVPGLAAVAGAEGIDPLTPVQMVLVPVLVGAAAWATVLWWSKAEVS